MGESLDIDSPFRGWAMPRSYSGAWCLPAKESPAGPLLASAFRERGLGPPQNFVTTDSMQLRTALIGTGRVLSPEPQKGFRLRQQRFRPAPL